METQIQVGQFEEMALRYNTALIAAKSTYEIRRPKPQRKIVERDKVSRMIVAALTLVMFASVIVSGSRTIEEFHGGFIGIVAFIMIEVGVIAYAFFRARRSQNENRLHNTMRWAGVGLGFTVIVGLSANLDNDLRNRGIVLSQDVRVFINLMVAVSAPILAFISSDILAMELMSVDIRQRQSDREYELTCETWETEFNQWWSREQNKWGVRIQVEKPRQIEAEISSNLIKNNEIKRFKPSPRLQKALDYLRANEGDIFAAPRDLELKITGVSYGTIHKAQQIIRSEKQVDE